MTASFSCPCGKTLYVNTSEPGSVSLPAFDAVVIRHFGGEHS